MIKFNIAVALTGKTHWDQAVHVLHYLGGTKNLGLVFHGDAEEDSMASLILGYTDSYWAGQIDTCRSTGGYVFKMSGAAVSWSSC